MKYQTVSEIFDANDRIREGLKQTLSSLTDEQASARPGGEKWSIGEIAEHVSMVGGGAYRICAKLLSKAEAAGQLSDGSVNLDQMAAKAAGIAGVKLEAPEIVHPSGKKSLNESIAALDETQEAFRALLPMFEKFDTSAATFPHPYFGDMTAVEWLVLYGTHEDRHLKQIQQILKKLDDSGAQA